METTRDFLKKNLSREQYAKTIAAIKKRESGVDLSKAEDALLNNAVALKQSLAELDVKTEESPYSNLGQELSTRFQLGKYADLQAGAVNPKTGELPRGENPDVKLRYLSGEKPIYTQGQNISPFEGQEVKRIGNNYLVKGADGSWRPVNRPESPLNSSDLPLPKDPFTFVIEDILLNPDALGDLAEFMPSVARFANTAIKGTVGELGTGVPAAVLTKDPRIRLAASVIGAAIGSGESEAENIKSQVKEAKKAGLLSDEETKLFDDEIRTAKTIGYLAGGAGQTLAPITKAGFAKTLGAIHGTGDKAFQKSLDRGMKYLEGKGLPKSALEAFSRISTQVGVGGKYFDAKRGLVLREEALREAEDLYSREGGKLNAAEIAQKTTKDFVAAASDVTKKQFTKAKQVADALAQRGEYITFNMAEPFERLKKEIMGITGLPEETRLKVIGAVQQMFIPQKGTPGITDDFARQFGMETIDPATGKAARVLAFNPTATPLHNILEATPSNSGLQNLINSSEITGTAIASKLGEFRNSLKAAIQPDLDDVLDFSKPTKDAVRTMGKVVANNTSKEAQKVVEIARGGFLSSKALNEILPQNIREKVLDQPLEAVQKFLLTGSNSEIGQFGKFLRGANPQATKQIAESLMASSIEKGEKQTLTRLKLLDPQAITQAKLADLSAQEAALASGKKLKVGPLKQATALGNVTRETGTAFSPGKIDQGRASENIGLLTNLGYGDKLSQMSNNLYAGENLYKKVPGVQDPVDALAGALGNVPLVGKMIEGAFQGTVRPSARALGAIMDPLSQIPVPAATQNLVFPGGTTPLTPEELGQFRIEEAQKLRGYAQKTQGGY